MADFNTLSVAHGHLGTTLYSIVSISAIIKVVKIMDCKELGATTANHTEKVFDTSYRFYYI